MIDSPEKLDLEAISELAERVQRCQNGEGQECSNLDKTITFYADGCWTAYIALRLWADLVFAGRMLYDAQVEQTLLTTARAIGTAAEPILAEGRKMDQMCYGFQNLDKLAGTSNRLRNLLERWVTPTLAVGPGPRTRVTEERRQIIKANLKRLRPTLKRNQPLGND